MNDLGQHRSETSPEKQTTALHARQSGASKWLLGCGICWISLGPLAQTISNPIPPVPVLAVDNPGTEAPSNPPSPNTATPHSPSSVTPSSATPTAIAADNTKALDNRSAKPPGEPPDLSQAWLSLTKRQKQALAPLSDKWGELTHQQKQKWLALARGFYQLTDPEQIVLHGRMREWAALSPKQRAMARFNFNSTMSMSIEDKRAQWTAYQQLSEDEKSKLTSGLRAPLKSGARNTAEPSKRLVKPPPIPADTDKVFQTIAPRQSVHPKTLLPQPPG